MKRLHPLLEQIREEQRIAGMAVSVTDRSGILFAEGFGVESIERPEVPVTSASVFRIASITKIFTGITVLSLVEERKLSLDAPIKSVLSDLVLSDPLSEETITLRQLLSHTAGLPAEYTPDGPTEEGQMEEVLLSGIREVEMIGRPGEQYLYSNWGIRLAALMAQRVTGTLFTRLVEERVLRPLKTARTTFDLHVAASYPLCLPHTEENGNFKVFHRLQENATRHAAGGLFSTAEDLSRMARLLLNEGVTDDGTRVLGKSFVDEMKKRHADSPANYDGYGLTLFGTRYRNGTVYGHHGSAPPYATSLVIHPESGLGIVTLMNTQRDDMRFEIPKRILDLLTE
ncbi:MAG: beta-lactamase family protein [Clostridia bacterium]|nr:beta-lactamase family protein [Clostridia bacterium]